MLHFLGVLHHQRGQRDAAVASIEQAIGLAPDDADAHNNLGNVLELGRLELAFGAYRRVVELAPGTPTPGTTSASCCAAGALTMKPTRPMRRPSRQTPARPPPGRIAATSWRACSGATRRSPLMRVCSNFGHETPPPPKPWADALPGWQGRGRLAGVSGLAESRARQQHCPPILLAAGRGEVVPARASNDCVRETSTRLPAASTRSGSARLRAPTLIAEWLDAVLAGCRWLAPRADAGCGPGRCADFLRPRARRLVDEI